MVKAAERRFGAEVAEGRAEFRTGTVETLPFAEASFDKALTVNTIYFWTSLEVGLAEIARVLVQGGRLVVGFVPKARMERMNMPADIFTPRDPAELTAGLAGAGFGQIELHQPKPEAGWLLATAVRS